MNKKASLELWNKYGEYVLMATAYRDSVIAEGCGCIIKDVDGNEFLDMCSGQICALLGHNHPELIDRVGNQLSKILHTGTTFLSPPVFEAAARLAEIAPGELKKSVFLSTGAEANECAFRIAKSYTGRDGIISFTRGYAGLTLATTSASNYGKGAFPTVPENRYILTPDCFNCPVNAEHPGCDMLCLKVSKEMLAGAVHRTAAIIFEPILSAGGMIVPPAGYFQRLREFADELDALMIADEAQTGFGRTGKWFATERFGIVPDILVVSKGVGGGFPASGVVITDSIASKITGEVRLFSSHQSDPVAATAIAAVIDIVNEEGLIVQAAEKGEYMMGKLRELSETLPNIANIRGYGLMVGFDVFEDASSRGISETMGYVLECSCRERGIHLQCIRQNRFRILPPLTITYEEIDRFIAVLEDAMRATLAGEYSHNDILPENPFTKALEQRSRSTLRKTLKRVWETSPEYWASKVKQGNRK